MIHSTVRMVMPRSRMPEALDILRSLCERTRVEAGCVDCSIHSDAENQNVLIFEQSWRSEPEMVRYLRSEEYRNVLLVMDMCSEKPLVRFDTIADSTGVETIEAARSIKKDGE